MGAGTPLEHVRKNTLTCSSDTMIWVRSTAREAQDHDRNRTRDGGPSHDCVGEDSMDDSPDDSPDAGSRENQPTTREIAAARQQQVYDPKSPRVKIVVLPGTETLSTKMAASHCER